MLSNRDVVNELGKSIAIFPLNKENLKGASYNLTASSYAWVHWNGNKKHYEHDGKQYKNGSSCRDGTNILLFPHCVTLIETREVISVTNKIGATFHARVSLVNRGIGHISTCMGPYWSGQNLIALHNITDSTITIKVGDEICSVIFYYLNKTTELKNQNRTGHTDKFANYGIVLSEAEGADLNADWKGNFQSVRDKMLGKDKESDNNEEYVQSKHDYKALKDLHKTTIRSYFNKKNIVFISIILIITALIFTAAGLLEYYTKDNAWWERAWTIFSSGVVIYIIQIIMSKIRKR